MFLGIGELDLVLFGDFLFICQVLSLWR